MAQSHAGQDALVKTANLSASIPRRRSAQDVLPKSASRTRYAFLMSPSPGRAILLHPDRMVIGHGLAPIGQGKTRIDPVNLAEEFSGCVARGSWGGLRGRRAGI